MTNSLHDTMYGKVHSEQRQTSHQNISGSKLTHNLKPKYSIFLPSIILGLTLEHPPTKNENMTELMTNGLMATLFITHVGIYFATYGFERIELSMKIDKTRLKLFYMRWAFSTSMIVGIFYLVTMPILLREVYFGV